MHPTNLRSNRPFSGRAAASVLAAAGFAVALGVPLGGTAANAQCVTSFVSASGFGNTLNAWRVSAGDFNGDGKLDVVYTHPGQSNRLSVHLGVGNGTFGASTIQGAGNGPTHATVADMNGDGKLDLVVANNGSPFFSLKYGNGDGTFADAIQVPTAGAAFDLSTVADFNGDGRIDVALSNTSGNVYVVLNNGNNTFSTGAGYQLSGSASIGGLETGDFNGDGRPDIVVVNRLGAAVGVMLNLGSGAFASAVSYPVGSAPNSLLVRDVNGDGKLDLITTNVGSGTVSVVPGNGNGTFGAAVSYPAGVGPTSAAFADFNGDGRADLAVRTMVASVPVVSVLPGLAGGGFGAGTSFPLPASGDAANNVVAGDFNGDGRPDLVCAMFPNPLQPCWVLLNNSTNAPTPVITQQPIGRVAAVGTFVELTTTVNTFAAQATYAWKKNGGHIGDGDIIWGSATPTLTISSLSADDTGSYQLHVSTPSCDGSQNVVTSMPAVIAVTVPVVPVVPANNNCAGATLIGNGTTTFSTANATTDGPSEANLGFCCNDLQIHKDVWFSYTATCTGPATVSLCGSNFDTKVAIYNGTSCPSAPSTAYAGNDDNPVCGPNSVSSQAAFNAVAGHSYLIRVGGYSGNSGDVTMNISCNGSGCLMADMGVQGGGFGRDGALDNNDFIAFIEAFFSQTTCP